MATKKSARFKAQVKPDVDATDAKRLRDTAVLEEDESPPSKPRKKSDVQIPRNVRAPSQAKDVAAVKGVAQVATTKTPNQSTSTRKRGSKARY
jgi:hypothetical protein